jgi:hypothetical protein
MLEICKQESESGIDNLDAADIENKFQRDMSENLLVKTQGLMNLYACDIPRNVANSLVNLFGDPSAVTKEQERLFGEQQSQQGKGGSNTSTDTNANTSQENIVSKQNNDITRASQNDLQQK